MKSCNKGKFPSYKEAEQFRNKYDKDQFMISYHCAICQSFHVQNRQSLGRNKKRNLSNKNSIYRQCLNKCQYTTPGQAEENISIIENINLKLRKYYCHECKQYHLTKDK